MKANIFRHPLVAVRWLDAHCRNQGVEYTEKEIDDYHRGEEVLTLGLMVRDNPIGVSLYTEETGPEEIRGLSFIPRAMIIEVIPLKVSKARAKKLSATGPPTPPE